MSDGSPDARSSGAELPRLYLITDRHVFDGGGCEGPQPSERLITAISAAIAGGVRLVQLREKDLAIEELRPLARELRERTAHAGARLLLNAADSPERLDLAREIGADGVHLTSTTSITVRETRRALGDAAIVGVSTHSLAEIENAAAGGASFVSFGPVLATPSKAALGAPLGLDALRDAAATCPLPLYALGGIAEENLDAVLTTAAHGIALIRALLKSEEPASSARRLLRRLQRPSTESL